MTTAYETSWIFQVGVDGRPAGVAQIYGWLYNINHFYLEISQCKRGSVENSNVVESSVSLGSGIPIKVLHETVSLSRHKAGGWKENAEDNGASRRN